MSGKDDEWMFNIEPRYLREAGTPPPYFDPLMVMAQAFTQSPLHKDPEGWKAMLLERANRPSNFDFLLEEPSPDIPAYNKPLGTTRRVEHTEDGVKVTMDLTDEGRMVLQSLDLENAFNAAYDEEDDDDLDELVDLPNSSIPYLTPEARAPRPVTYSFEGEYSPSILAAYEKELSKFNGDVPYQFVKPTADRPAHIPSNFEPDTGVRTRTQIVEIRKGFSQITKTLIAITAVVVALMLSALSAVLAGGLWVFWKIVVEFVKFIRHIVEDLDG